MSDSNPVAAVLSRLEGVKRNGQGYQARCPAHEDHRQSLMVAEGDDGRALLHCHAGCDLEAILAALQLESRDLFEGSPAAAGNGDNWTPKGPAIATYPYHDESGQPLYTVCRTAGKDFPAWHPDPTKKHGKAWNLTGVRRVPYHLPQVIEEAGRGGIVYVVEGEKDVEALEAIGAVATCNPGGAGKWRDESAEYLRGAHVIVIADKDEPGRKHAAKVAASLRSKAASVVIVEAKEGKDAADHLAAGHGPEDFALVDLAEEVQAGPRFRVAPELASVATERPEWILEGYLARGAITELGAKIKAGKTTFTAAAVSAILAGSPFVGRKTARCPVLYLTEERAPSFRAALCRVGIQDSPDLHILLRQESGGGSWAEVGDAAIAHAQKVGAGLLVVDTLSDWASIAGDQENSAGAALEAVRPLQKAAAAGLAVLVDRHERKSGGEIGDSTRGSSAFGGAVDILLSLRRMTSPGHENRRELVAVGRFDDIPPKVVIELEAGEYHLLGDGDELERQEARRRVLDLLPTLPEDARTFDAILEDCGEGITRTTLHRALAGLLEDGQVRREKGAGTAGARGYGWWLAEVTL